ncbi:class I SAM-dependent methyltransferase [Streptomyces sp. NPDC054802]
MAHGNAALRPVDLHGNGVDLWARIRREVYGVEARQHGWASRDELCSVVGWLRLGPGSRLLDVGCGEGGPARFVSARSGATAVGVDHDWQLLRMGSGQVVSAGLPVWLVQADAGAGLPFGPGVFDAVNCTDVLPHLGPLDSVLAEWSRLLKGPSSRLLVIDPAVPGGPLTKVEAALRSGGVPYEFRSGDVFSGALARHGFDLVDQIDLTAGMVRTADAWMRAVERAYDELVNADGADAVRHQLAFCRFVVDAAGSGRLSRIAYVARRAVRG